MIGSRHWFDVFRKALIVFCVGLSVSMLLMGCGWYSFWVPLALTESAFLFAAHALYKGWVK